MAAYAGPHVLASNNAEGGSDGTTVTTGNSGGDSGEAWDGLNITGSSTLVFTDTDPIHDDLSYLVTASGGFCNVFWNGAGALGEVQDGVFTVAVYVKFSTLPSSSSPFVLFQEDSGGGDRTCDLRVLSTGALRFASAAQSSIVDFSGSGEPMQTGVVYRVELELDFTGANPAYWVALFDGDATTPIREASGTSSGVGPQVGRVTVGRVQSPDYTAMFDSVGVGTDRLGPRDDAVPEPASVPPSVFVVDGGDGLVPLTVEYVHP